MTSWRPTRPCRRGRRAGRYNRIHFASTVRPEDLDWRSAGCAWDHAEGIVAARAIEDSLYAQLGERGLRPHSRLGRSADPDAGHRARTTSSRSDSRRSRSPNARFVEIANRRPLPMSSNRAVCSTGATPSARSRDRRRDGDGQDRAVAGRRRGAGAEGIRADHLGRLAPGLPRPRHRDGQGDAAERRGVPHHGLDLVDPDAPFTVADFADHARGGLADIGTRGGLAILVGGTGLYLRAVARARHRRAAERPGDPRAPRG